jgi:predicted O-linked N-acetylglucosamine transferase (SPINDLY family)
MALNPAPVQVSWLGYVNTTGLPVIDYRLTDAIADPPGMEPFYSERLIRLPDAFFCYEPPTMAPEVGALPALANGTVTFGSLNNPAKITQEVISLWAKVLLQLPESRLIMVGAPFADEFIRRRYHDLFAGHGVEQNRIELISSLPMREYLNLYNRLDIALDPFPHNGHTITCHTLWMGVPVITLAGNRYAARMGASVLSGAGLPELIAHTPEEYLTITTTLAQDRQRLADLRHSMRDRLRHSVICDTRRFANNFIQTMHAIQRSYHQAK